MPLPLTLLAGLSSTLRDDLIRCLVLRRPGLVAVAYDPVVGAGAVHVDRTVVDCFGVVHREPLALTRCCLSCTVMEDVENAVGLVAAADRWAELVVALPATLRPGRVAAAVAGHPDVTVDTVTTVVDARLLRAHLHGDDLLADRGMAAAPADRRSTAELLVGQLEDADVLAVADLHALGTDSAQVVRALLSHLAPLAVQVPLGPGGAGCDDVVGTGRYDRSSSTGDRERLAALAVGLCPPVCDVRTLHWQADAPLHPVRLSDALADVVAGVVRSRGHVSLADRPGQRVRWESAGGSLALGDPQPWPGPPSSELVLTGVGLDVQALRRRLDACVATSAEQQGALGDDPFAAALGAAGVGPGDDRTP